MANGGRTAGMERLLGALLERTRTGSIPWAPSSSGDGFEFDGTEASVVVRSKDNDDRFPFILELLNKELGEVADYIETGSIATGPEPWDEEPFEYNEDLGELYFLARTQALKIDELTASLLKDLGEPVAVAKPAGARAATPAKAAPPDDE